MNVKVTVLVKGIKNIEAEYIPAKCTCPGLDSKDKKISSNKHWLICPLSL